MKGIVESAFLVVKGYEWDQIHAQVPAVKPANF